MSFGVAMRNSVSLGLGGIPSLASGTRGSNPIIDFNFALTQSLDPRITFTRASTATFTGSNGLIQTAAINAPRFDYNPTTLESLGLLIEEQRTNLVTYSEQFDNAAWTKADVVITPNIIVSPNATLDGDSMIENTATNGHLLLFSVPITTGLVYTISFYLKVASGTRNILVYAQNSSSYAGLNAGAKFAVSGSAIVASTTYGTTTSTVTSVGNNWYRCTVTLPASIATSAGQGFRFALDNGTGTPASGAQVYTGDGSSGFYIWGAQLEAGAFATSYIPTVASQVTRSADSAVMTGTNFSSWYNPAEGTMFTQYIRNGLTVSAGIFTMDGTSGNNIRFNSGAGTPANQRLDVALGGVSQAQLLVTTTGVVGTTYKIAGAYKVNSIAAVENNGTLLTDFSANIPTVTQAGIGRNSFSGYLNGTIAQVSYYPQRLPNSQLQALTV